MNKTKVELVEKCVVRDKKGKPILYLNPALVEQLKVSDENLRMICLTHSYKHEILQKMKRKNISKKKLREYATTITQLEFELQDLWGFPQDINYHKFWEVCGYVQN